VRSGARARRLRRRSGALLPAPSGPVRPPPGLNAYLAQQAGPLGIGGIALGAAAVVLTGVAWLDQGR
jgi:hypothetical protein